MNNYRESGIVSDSNSHMNSPHLEWGNGLTVTNEAVSFPFKKEYIWMNRSECYFHPGIDICHLWPTQTYDGYKDADIRKIDKAYKATEGNFLYEFPIVLCALPEGMNSFALTILDGHTRSRRAPLHGITSLPSIIISIETAAKLYGKIDSEAYGESLKDQVMRAVSNFSMYYSLKGKEYMPPQLIDGFELNSAFQ